ncbi:MAG: hypothetical protein ACKPKO_20185, partial [Candidatus Fonsibacter sp.]
MRIHLPFKEEGRGSRETFWTRRLSPSGSATDPGGDASRLETCKSHKRLLKRLLLKQFGRVRGRLRKPIEETPQAPAPEPVWRRLKTLIEETPQAPAPKRTRITTKSTVPHILPPSGGPQGGAFGIATPKAKAKPRAKAKYEKPEALVQNTT